MSRTEQDRIWTRARGGLRALGVVVCVGAAVSAWGCAKESDAQAAVRTARQKVLAINSGSSPASPELRRAIYQDVQNSLRGAADKLEGSAASAALVLLGEAQAGLAEVQAADAVTMDNRMLSLAAQARSAASLYVSQAALEASLKGYDPSRTMEDLREASNDFQADLTAVQASRDAMKAQMDALLAQAAEQSSMAKDRRLEAARLRADAAERDPATRADAAQRSYEVSRIADEHDRTAADLRAQAEKIRPQIATAEIDIERWKRLGELANQSRSNLTAAVNARLEQAARAKASADEAANRLHALVQEIEALRTGDHASAYDGAATNYTAAIGSFRRAAQVVTKADAKAPQGVALTQAQSALADLYRSRARTLDVVVDLYDRLAQTSPALPQRQAYVGLAGEVGDQVDELLASAAESFMNAKSSIASAGLRGDLRDRGERIGQMLNEAAGRVGGVMEEEEAPIDDEAPMDETYDDSGEMAPEDGEVAPEDEAAPE